MANPLALYVRIKPEKQVEAQGICNSFADLAGGGLSAIGLVHYAIVVAIPNEEGKIDALLLTTSFDGDMEPYLDRFWNDPSGGTKLAFQSLAGLSRDIDVDDIDVTTFDASSSRTTSRAS